MDGQRRFAVIGTDPRLAAAGRALARAGFICLKMKNIHRSIADCGF